MIGRKEGSLQSQTGNYSSVTAKHMSSGSVFIKKMRCKEEVKLRKCWDITRKIKNVIAKEKNVLMDVKNDFKKLKLST